MAEGAQGLRRVVILAEAALDLAAAEDFYEAREPGVGTDCVHSLLEDIESLASFHGIHSVHLNCYRMLARRFPFGIYYLETPEEARVVAVLDLRRDPAWLHQQMAKRRPESENKREQG